MCLLALPPSGCRALDKSLAFVPVFTSLVTCQRLTSDAFSRYNFMLLFPQIDSKLPEVSTAHLCILWTYHIVGI